MTNLAELGTPYGPPSFVTAAHRCPTGLARMVCPLMFRVEGVGPYTLGFRVQGHTPSRSKSADGKS